MKNKYPKKAGLEPILRTAFAFWSRTLFYQVSYSLLFFSLFFLGYFYLFKNFGLWDEISQYSDLLQTDFPAFNKKMEAVAQLPQAQGFILGIFFLLAVISPLNVGFYNIYNKVEQGEKISINDLFAGYRGLTFFKFLGFYLFWLIVFSYANALLLLGVVWAFLTVFSVPLMFFKNLNTFQGIKLSFTILRQDFPTILVAVVVATLFSLSGLILFGFGFLFTFPFWHAMIYTLYRHYFSATE